ncbi:MAG: hypothetical protein ACJ751_03480 [Niastella sp.]|uniref:hypothetical protein n=1 Tax=Niastella sp. TaxID=1869183 RepID=UPI00389A475A
MRRTRALNRYLILFCILICHYAGLANFADSASVSKITATFQKIKSENRLVGEFKESDMASLPIGILKEINGKAYVIAIDQARFTPQGAFFNVYAQLALPGSDETMSFAALNVAFTPGGIAAATGTRLELVSTHTLKINDKVNLVIPGDHNNYIEWDCGGFKSVNLKGQFEFQKGFLEPLDETSDKVTASFQINAKDLHNIMARVDITPFTIHGLKDFGFEVKEAVVDMSDIANPEGLMLIGNDAAAWDGEPNLWQGFYLKQLNIYLPKELANGKGDRPMVSATDMTIDNSGVSGKFSASNIIKIGDASAGGWPLSLDYIEVQLVHNRLMGGTLKGDLNIDFLGNDPLRYTAAVETRQEDTYYAFVLETTEEKTFHTFIGDIHLFPNSQVKIEKYKGQFLPGAVLHGKVDLNKGILKAPGIGFQDLTLSTQKPYVHKGTLSLDGSIGFKIGNFSCGFDNISLGLNAGQFAIGAHVRMALMNSEDKGFSATTGVMVLGNVVEEKETVTNGKITYEKTHTRWKFDRVKVNEIAITAKTTAFQMEGTIALFEDHPIYGNGFKGRLSLKLPALPMPIVAHAIFGAKDDYKYWHADAFVPIRIPIATGFSIRRLLGGLSYHMERPPTPDQYSVPDSDTTGMDNADGLLSYVPNKEAGMGFLAGATIATDPTAAVFNADVMLEIMFSTEGGLRYVQFDGTGQFFANLAQHKPDEAAKAPITAVVYIRYDNTNSTFHASIKTYIDLFGLVKGTGPNNLAVEAVMHFEPGAWWMYVGRPSQMMGLNMLGIATVQSYFMAGTKVEDMPPPPPEVTSVLDIGSGNFMEKENSMSTGRGIGFGVHFKVSAGIGKDGGFIYAYLGVGAGADILLRDYGDARCKGSGQIGVNGWYASGQAYAYLQGRVGIRVKVLGKKKEFDIIYLTAAALMQAKLPNPSWFMGAVGVKYSILGGLVKGKASFKVEVGSQCELVSGKEIDIKIINDMQPGDLSKNISVFGSPQVAFNLAMEKSFSMMNNEDVVTTYQIKMDEFKMVDRKTGEIKGNVDWNDNKDVATLNFRDILPPDADLVTSVKVHIEKWTGSGWEPLKENGAVDYETKSVTFHTGTAPNNIPAENIAYSYPVNQQYNFYANEYSHGYVKLKRGQPYLFNAKDSDGDWKYYARFVSGDGKVVNAAVSYDLSNAQVNFDLPAGLSPESVFHLGIVKTPANTTNGNDNATTRSTTTTDDDGSETTVNETALKGMALAATEVSLMESAFRTSKYNTFKEKMNATSNTMDLYDIATDYVPVIGKRFDSYETFDKFELGGDGNSAAPLVFAKATANNNWLQNKIVPLLYQSYPVDNDITIEQRDVKLFGTTPLLAVSVFNNEEGNYQLTSEAISAGTAQTMAGRFRVMYFLSYVSYQDYHELLSKAVAKYLSGNKQGAAPAGVQQLLSTTYPEMETNQQYSVELNYRLPGTNKVTSTVNCNIKYQ